MYFFLMQVLCGFNLDVIHDMLMENWCCFVIVIMYWFCGTVTLMNMVVGVLVGVISDVTERETEEISLHRVEAVIRSLFEADTDGDEALDSVEWQRLIEDTDTVALLQNL